MAYSEQNPLDYRSGGDRVKMWGAKYKQEIPHIYNILNSLLKHQAYGDVAVQDEDGAMKIFTVSIENQDGTVTTERHLAIGVDTGETFQWVDIGKIAPRFGAPLTSEALTNDDVAQNPYDAYKLVKTDENGVLPADITGSASRMVGKVIAVNNLSDGQVLVWRAYDQRWHNENKAAVGDGKALELKNGETTICLYSGESDQTVDVGKWNNVTLIKLADNIADIRYVPTMENTASATAKMQKATPEAEGRTFAMRDTDGFLLTTTPATNDDSNKAATTANVSAKIGVHNDDTTAHAAAFTSQLNSFKGSTMGYRMKATVYAKGAIAYSDGLPSGWYLEAIAGGTTSSTGIILPETIEENVSVNDNTVIWKIRKMASIHDVQANDNRQPATTYELKDIRYYSGLPVGWYLECTTAGITDSGDITLPSPVVENVTVTDGTVVWKIRRISSADGVAVGIILPFAGNGAIPSGYLLCDGAAYSRTAFPDLFAAIGTDYGSGDGSTTFNVPDSNQAKRFLQGDTVAGQVKEAGLPNITGSVGDILNVTAHASGAFTQVSSGTNPYPTGNTGNYRRFTFDASRSSAIYGNSTTVQPDALTTRFIIKAFDGQTADSALIDITQFENELGGKVDKADCPANGITNNSIYRGKDLTAYFESGRMSADMATGKWDNIFVGDYIIKSVTINGVTYADVKWIIMHINYHLHCGDTETTQNHVVLMPEEQLGTRQMNPTDITAGGYVGSAMWTTHMPLVVAGIEAAFGADHVLAHRELLTNAMNGDLISANWTAARGAASGWAWVTAKANLASEEMVYGAPIWSSSAHDSSGDTMQLAAFKLNRGLICSKRYWWWLRSVAAASSFCVAGAIGRAYLVAASASDGGVRPYFLLH